MITCRGTAFAERMLNDLNAEQHGNPPSCPGCHRDCELRRSSDRRNDRAHYWWCDHCKRKP